MSSGFDISFEDLPAEIPVFPLARVILLPRTQLPLNIFEPRYLAMTEYAMQHGRLIGMIQQKAGQKDGQNLYKTGCAGRITSFEETQDGRYVISLKGVCRFDIAEELAPDSGGFRRVRPDWTPYERDFKPDSTTDVCRDTMMQNLRGYFDKMNMFCDQWEKIRDIDCDSLISTLSVVCPFGVEEKQALLEAKTLAERARLLQAFLDMVSKCGAGAEKTSCH